MYETASVSCCDSDSRRWFDAQQLGAAFLRPAYLSKRDVAFRAYAGRQRRPSRTLVGGGRTGPQGSPPSPVRPHMPRRGSSGVHDGRPAGDRPRRCRDAPDQPDQRRRVHRDRHALCQTVPGWPPNAQRQPVQQLALQQAAPAIPKGQAGHLLGERPSAAFAVAAKESTCS